MDDTIGQMVVVFKKRLMPDHDLTAKILKLLGIYDIVDLEFALNKYIKQERDAAMAMLENFIPDLTSGDKDRYEKAKAALADVYHPIASTDEEAML